MCGQPSSSKFRGRKCLEMSYLLTEVNIYLVISHVMSWWCSMMNGSRVADSWFSSATENVQYRTMRSRDGSWKIKSVSPKSRIGRYLLCILCNYQSRVGRSSLKYDVSVRILCLIIRQEHYMIRLDNWIIIFSFIRSLGNYHSISYKYYILFSCE